MSDIITSHLSLQMQQHKLQNYRPSFWTQFGLITAKFKRVEFNRKNRLTGVYDLEVHNPSTGAITSTRYIYGLDQFGNPVQLKQFTPRQIR